MICLDWISQTIPRKINYSLIDHTNDKPNDLKKKKKMIFTRKQSTMNEIQLIQVSAIMLFIFVAPLNFASKKSGLT